MANPYTFDEFFASQQQETVSPFLTPNSRRWAKNLALKSSIFSAVALAVAFVLHFFLPSLSYFLLTFIYFITGVPALIHAWENIRNWEINIDILMTLAAFASLILGAPLEGALLLVLFSLSGSLEETVSFKAKSALHTLHNLAPKEAFFITESGDLVQKSVHELQVGDHIFVKAGDTIPLDGIVISGISSMNISHLTGESLPIPIEKGSEVTSGGINMDAGISVEVSKQSSESTLTSIIQLIKKAHRSKAKVEKLLDKFGKHYSFTIMLLALVLSLALPLFGLPLFGFEGSIYRALTFLITASPCALIIATPTAYLSAISSCASKGILLRGGITFDALATCKHLSFDKTGTLTEGSLLCDKFLPLNKEAEEMDEKYALSIAATLETEIVHPIASAIIEFSKEKGITNLSHTHFSHTPGQGISAIIGRKKVKLGSDIFLFGQKKELPLSGKMSAYLQVGEAIFLFLFQDKIKPSAKKTIETLQSLGIETAMLSGDSEENASLVAENIGLEKVYSSLTPEAKLNLVESLASKGHAMVGDGINDAPSLARSTVGIAMGKMGSALAIESSDIVLLQDDLSTIPWVIKKARSTKKIIRQNLSLSLGVIFFASLFALLGSIPLWLGVILHEGGTLLVGLNSLRLLKK